MKTKRVRIAVEWRPTWEGSPYEVSNTGIVRSNLRKGRFMKTTTQPRGYPKIMLIRGGAREQHMVHRLVATAFIPNPEGKPQVNHKDGIKTNNAASNLEWVTASENRRHSIDVTGRGKVPYRGFFSRTDARDIIEQCTLGGVSAMEMARRKGVNYQVIYRMLVGRTYR